MSISKEEVKHVSELAKLELSDKELELFTSQLDDIIGMAEQLSEVDTTDVPVTTHITDVLNVMREDVAEKGTDRDLLFKNAPDSENGFIKVPAIIDESGEA
ncbi:Asp-tRNA(Asn)/Glu-tRNA(Gln) amidotransferase subunit GatC [Dellaglioa sp. BT-FLS60]